jgi:HK97 family phage portal protein
MAFIDKILSTIGLSRKINTQIPSTERIVGDPFVLWQSSKKITSAKAMELNSGWVYACVRAIAEEIANIEFRLFRVKKDNTIEEIKEHELLDLLYGVNNFQTGFELLYTTAAHLELTGNAYWFLDGVEKEKDKPTAIYILNPRFVKVVKTEFPQSIAGYQYIFNNQTKDLKTYQVVHFKYPDPNDLYEGVGTVQSILEWIAADNFASQVNLNYFKNGARLSGVLESEIYTQPEQLEYIKKSFQQLYANAANAYQIAALPKGTKYVPMSDTPKDMDFANLQQFMRDKILAGFRVPKTILGTAESETNRATAETADYVFSTRTIKPKMKLIVSYLNEFLVYRYGDDLFLDFVDPVPENVDLKLREYETALAGKPYKSVNEVREEQGLPPIDNGDAVMTDFSSIPLGKPQSKTTTKPKVKISGKTKPSTKYARASKKRNEIAKEIAEKAAEAIKKLAEKQNEVKQKNITNLSDDEYEVLWRGFISRVTPYEKAQAEAVKNLNSKQKKEVIANLEKVVKSKAINEEDLFNKDQWISLLIDLSTPIATDLFEKEAKEAASLLGIDLSDPITPEVKRAIGQAMELMSRKYNETTLTLLKDKLEQGLSEGASLDELKDLVSQVYEFSDDVRAEQVARTETFRIANAATHEAWRQSGVVKTIKWYTAADERVCEFCAPMHGKVVDIEEKFFEKGDEITGSEGGRLAVDYSDVEYPPLHPSCRCYIRPEEISI